MILVIADIKGGRGVYVRVCMFPLITKRVPNELIFASIFFSLSCLHGFSSRITAHQLDNKTRAHWK